MKIYTKIINLYKHLALLFGVLVCINQTVFCATVVENHITPFLLTLNFPAEDLSHYGHNMNIKNELFQLSYPQKLSLYGNIFSESSSPIEDSYHYSNIENHLKIRLLEITNNLSDLTFSNLTSKNFLLFKKNWKKLDLDEKEFVLPHSKITQEKRMKFLIENYSDIFRNYDYFPSKTLSGKPFRDYTLKKSLEKNKYLSASIKITNTNLSNILLIHEVQKESLANTIISIDYKVIENFSDDTLELLGEYFEDNFFKSSSDHKTISISFNPKYNSSPYEFFTNINHVLNLSEGILNKTLGLSLKIKRSIYKTILRSNNCKKILNTIAQ